MCCLLPSATHPGSLCALRISLAHLAGPRFFAPPNITGNLYRYDLTNPKAHKRELFWNQTQDTVWGPKLGAWNLLVAPCPGQMA